MVFLPSDAPRETETQEENITDSPSLMEHHQVTEWTTPENRLEPLSQREISAIGEPLSHHQTICVNAPRPDDFDEGAESRRIGAIPVGRSMSGPNVNYQRRGSDCAVAEPRARVSRRNLESIFEEQYNGNDPTGFDFDRWAPNFEYVDSRMRPLVASNPEGADSRTSLLSTTSRSSAAIYPLSIPRISQENMVPLSYDTEIPSNIVAVSRTTQPLPSSEVKPRYIQNLPPMRTTRCRIVWILPTILLLLSVIIFFVRMSDQDRTELSSQNQLIISASALETIRTRGNLNCGVVENPGFSMFNETSREWVGFEIDLCRAVGAAIFGEDGRVNFIALSNAQRFGALESREVDLLAAGATYTMERDLYEPSAQAGFTFSTPYLYNGMSFAGLPQFVSCAESFNTTGDCSDIRICVQAITTHVSIVEGLFPSSAILLAPTVPTFYSSFTQGYCNVLAGEQFDLALSNVLQAGYSGDYYISTKLYSKEPTALVTRDNDTEWSDFVNWAFLALLTAENMTITQQTAQKTVSDPAPIIYLTQLKFYQAVATVGNYEEMYDRHLQSIVPRAPINQQNHGVTPLIYSFPFGNNEAVGPGPTDGGTLRLILQRGVLRCGVGTDPLFSEFNKTGQQWSGIDVNVCLAISAAIFNGTGSTQFISVDPLIRFAELANGNLDVLVRTTGVNYDRDVNETSTGKGFTFSPPNFYTGLRFGGIPQYSACANSLDTTFGNCSKLLICVNNATTNIANAMTYFDDRYIIPKLTEEAVYECLVSKESNVIGGFGIFNATVRTVYNGPYQEGTELFSRDNLAPVTNQDDPQWSSFVTWVMYALYYAEEQGITQATYYKMPRVNLFGSDFTYMFQNIIQAVGSYGEAYNRIAEKKYPREPINNLNLMDSPMHYPPPGLFGLV